MHNPTMTLASDLSLTARSTLAVSGLILLGVGVPILLGPLAYQAGMGVDLPRDPNLLSDLRAMGGSLLGFGILLVSGAKSSARLGRGAAISGAVLYASYGLSRLFSMAVDGFPATSLIIAAVIELLVAVMLATVARRPWAHPEESR